METEKYLSVTALTKYIKYKFDHDVHLANVLLEGEISNFKHHSRGHFYFTLKDESSQISATMFYSEASKVGFEPEDGMKVYVKGTVSVYEPQGTYSINVYEMEQKGLGSLYIAYEKLKKELEEEGLFDKSHKKPIPRFPKSIGVLTSPTGAAVRDVINTVKRRYPLATIFVYPTLVQGEEAKYSVVSNIELANQQGYCDTLIVGRGGGSIEDLWAFNERIVAEAIYNSNIPIISAVGHETDTTIADYVADMRAATPTAAAELATPNLLELKEYVNQLSTRIDKGLENYLNQIKERLVHLDQRLSLLSPEAKLSMLELKLHKLEDQMNNSFNRIVKEKGYNLQVLIEKLKVLNPLAILDKGFSVTEGKKGIVKSVNDVSVGDDVTIKVKDGSINCLVKGVNEK